MTKQKTISIGLIGFGLIGQDRLKSIQSLQKEGKSLSITGVFDPYTSPDKRPEGITFFTSLTDFYRTKPDWVFIAVPHDEAATLTKEALEKGCQVLVEKPLGRNLAEAQEIATSATQAGQLWVGFNYRFFEGIAQIINDAKAGKFGRLVSVNILMGHGCNPDITKSWKLDPIKAGGGCLIDPGIHLLDLCRILSNNQLTVRSGQSWDGFWKTGIEEETHLLLEGADGLIVNFQVSVVHWRSTFRLEINGTDGYGVVSGRNRSYGPQRYITGPRWGWQNAPSQKESEKLILESAGEDVFTREIEALLYPDTKSLLQPCSAKEALLNMELLATARKVLGLNHEQVSN